MINYEALLYAVKSSIDERLWDKYDFDTIIRNAELAYDDTAVKVKGNDFIMFFDLINYDLLNIETTDLDEED